MADIGEAPACDRALYGPVFKANPFPAYAAMRQESPFCYRTGSTGKNMVWFVTRDAKDHARLRKLLAPAFQKRHIDRLRPRIQQIADALIDTVQHQQRMDLIEDFAFPLPAQVIAELIGLPHNDLARFRAWARSIIIAPFETNPDVFTERAAFIAYLETCFEARRQQPRDDLMTRLVVAQERGQLSTEELFSATAVLVTAGHETTLRMIGNSMLALFQHPEQGRLVTDHPALLEQALEELLRYNGSVERATTRFAAEDIDLGGRCIRRGDTVVVVLASANRDERVFKEPDTLDFTRSSCPHLSFGYGPHYCLGAPLARLETHIAIRTLLDRLPDVRLAAPVESLEWITVPALRGVRKFPVVWG